MQETQLQEEMEDATVVLIFHFFIKRVTQVHCRKILKAKLPAILVCFLLLAFLCMNILYIL
jgi:hypothetical protein